MSTSPTTLRELTIKLANYEFVTKPAAAITLLRKKIPKEHHSFYKEMGVSDLHLLYKAQPVSTGKVLKMFDNAEGSTESEERVLSYLDNLLVIWGLTNYEYFLDL